MGEKSPEELRELLRSFVKLQDGKSEGENFIGVLVSDGEYGVFIDKEGKLLDGTDTFGRVEGNTDREVIKARVLELYKEHFPDGNLDEIEKSMTLQEE